MSNFCIDREQVHIAVDFCGFEYIIKLKGLENYGKSIVYGSFY